MKKMLFCLLFCTIFLAACTLKDSKSTDKSEGNNNSTKEITEILDDSSKSETPSEIDDNSKNNTPSEIDDSSKNNTPPEIDDSSKNNTSSEITKVKGKVQVYEGTYFDSSRYGENKPNPYCEVVISNVTDTSFDFTVYEVTYTDIENSDNVDKKVIFLKNTAIFIEDGTKATFYGNDYTLNFTFPNNHNAYPVITDINISGFKPLEGKTYLNNGIPGHEFG